MPRLPIADNDQPHALTELLPGLPRFAGKFIPVEQTRELYQRMRTAPQGFQLETLLEEMKVKLDVQSADLERIPVKGPLVAVANHPFGVLDRAALVVLMSRVRPDVKILTDPLLEGIPGLHERCIFVDPFPIASSTDKNLKPLKQASHFRVPWFAVGRCRLRQPAGFRPPLVDGREGG